MKSADIMLKVSRELQEAKKRLKEFKAKDENSVFVWYWQGKVDSLTDMWRYLQSLI